MTDENRYEGVTPSASTPPPVIPPARAGTSTPGTAPSSGGGTESVKDEAQQVAGRAADGAEQVAGVAADRASDVAHTAKEQVKDTAAEAKEQARNLYEEGRQQVTEQAGAQQQRLAGGMRSMSSELSSMADSSEEQGMASALARQLAERLGNAGSWLEDREPAQVLDEISSYARRHPVSFMAIAAGLGLLAGRVARSAKDAGGGSSPTSGTSGSGSAGVSSGATRSPAPSGSSGSHSAQPYGAPPAQPYGSTGTAGVTQEAPFTSGPGAQQVPGAPAHPAPGTQPAGGQVGGRP
ncbi:hypothetical protein [Pseudactinotalea terrae]|uniref:hypothetical protein n=1 Tax=Pseudactinotalea terrae TaxID=1743262 RepID=UPI0012E1DB31|nr:hypothetical protein [Pseudactinotalea terrae]